MWQEEYQDALEYIDAYWQKIIYKPSRLRLKYPIKNVSYLFKPGQRKEASNNTISLPHYYFVPNDNKFTYIFYWDSFFMFRGLMGTKREWLMHEMVENFLYLYETYQIVPNFSAPASMGRSQPPFLTSMIMDTYFVHLNSTNPYYYKSPVKQHFYKLANRTWLKRAINIAKKEYENVWLDKAGAYNHSVKDYDLSRYGDRDIGYAHSSELESGWDMTSRFYNRCDQFLPIDLNSYLYKYETDFARAAQILGEKDEEKMWLARAQKRKAEINAYMWDGEAGFFFDYGYMYKKISSFYSLASYAPLWAGIATYEQAKRAVSKINKFESPFGLTITAKESLAKPIDLTAIQKRYHPAIEEIIKPKQWDYPNIWSPLEYLTVIGLLRYGFTQDAKRIMEKSVKAHGAVFRKHKTFFEKLNGETGEQSVGYHYAMQQGFGWTNAAFYRYIQILDALESGQQIYKTPTPQDPPYDLAILQ